MKNLLSTLLLFIGFSAFLSAQSVFKVLPSPASATGALEQPDVEVHAKITNLTANLVHLKWERREISLTPGCETAVCDPNICWARSVSTKPFDMDPNEIGDLLMHFYNNEAPCSGIMHLKVTNLDNPADSSIAVYLFNATSGTSNLPAANVKLYPNPVTEFFSLENAENVAAIRVFSLDGREVARFETNTSNFYSLQNQPAGNYVIALEDKNGQAFQAMDLRKL